MNFRRSILEGAKKAFDASEKNEGGSDWNATLTFQEENDVSIAVSLHADKTFSDGSVVKATTEKPEEVASDSIYSYNAIQMKVFFQKA